MHIACLNRCTPLSSCMQHADSVLVCLVTCNLRLASLPGLIPVLLFNSGYKLCAPCPCRQCLEACLIPNRSLHHRKPLNRRFIVVEGIYRALGDLAPLADIARLKHKYRFRLVVDESLALGTLGETGRGACEHAGLSKQDVDIICASMSEPAIPNNRETGAVRSMLLTHQAVHIDLCYLTSGSALRMFRR